MQRSAGKLGPDHLDDTLSRCQIQQQALRGPLSISWQTGAVFLAWEEWIFCQAGGFNVTADRCMPTARFSKFGDRFAFHTIKLAVLWSGVLQAFSAQTTQTACWGHKDSAVPQTCFGHETHNGVGKDERKAKTFQEWISKPTSNGGKGSSDCSRGENLYSLQFHDFYLDQNTLAYISHDNLGLVHSTAKLHSPAKRNFKLLQVSIGSFSNCFFSGALSLGMLFIPHWAQCNELNHTVQILAGKLFSNTPDRGAQTKQQMPN